MSHPDDVRSGSSRVISFSAGRRPPFEVVESYTCGKDGSDDGREDAVVVTDHHAFVLDGVGSYPTFEVAGKGPGRLARDVAVGVLQQLDVGVTLRQVVDEVTAAIAAELQRVGVEEQTLPRPPAVQLVGYSPHFQQAWRVGDASVRVGDDEFLRDQNFDLLCNGMRTMLRHAAVASGVPREEVLASDPMRSFLEQLVEAQSKLLNWDADSPYAFGWVSARRCPDRFLETFEVPPATDVVLASDGYVGVPESLESAERQLRAELDRQPLVDVSRRIDRDVVGSGRVSFDDRAYLRLRTR